ncbi:Cytochrome P450, partial [Tolypocladium paradoxum]
MQTVPLVVGVTVAYGVYCYVSSLLHNIAEAKRSGFNYVVVPVDPLAIPWQLTHRLWMRIIMRFPESWWEEWLEYGPSQAQQNDPKRKVDTADIRARPSLVIPDMPYRTGFERFRRHGEAFLVVSPRTVILHVANAEVIRHVATHREQFPKWTASYDILRQFGENVLTSEGQVWRTHRKVTSASFNERNAALVFREAILQTQGMIRTWTGPTGVRREPLRTVERDTMRLALNIIGYVGFGLRMLWPGQTLPAGSDPRLVKYASLEAPAGHKMSFVDTMSSVMDNILLLLLTPKWLLRALPLERARASADAYEDYVKYMDELMEDRMEEARRGERAGEGMDLMGQLVRTAYEAQAQAQA